MIAPEMRRHTETKRAMVAGEQGARDVELAAWAVAELERLQPELLGLADMSRRDRQAQANAVFRRIIGA